VVGPRRTWLNCEIQVGESKFNPNYRPTCPTFAQAANQRPSNRDCGFKSPDDCGRRGTSYVAACQFSNVRSLINILPGYNKGYLGRTYTECVNRF
jgi:hypothetical protein